MKKILVATTRWEYYVSNAVGLFIVIGVIAWFGYLSFDSNGLNFKSVFLWVAVLLCLIIPFALISILSSMKAVDVFDRGLVISYMFRKHKNAIEFSEIAKISFSTNDQKDTRGKNSVRDSFTLLLTDNRVFEFSRSQFHNYNKFKTLCSKAVSSR